VQTGLETALTILSLLAIVGPALAMTLIPETKRRSLEDISWEMAVAGSQA
jgi:hypothetical protein